MENNMHQSLESRRCVAETERHNLPLKAAVTTVKCRFMLVGLAHCDLMVPISQVKLGEATRSLQPA